MKTLPQNTIFQVLFYTSWRLCVLSIGLMASVMLITALIALRGQMEHHLQLVGRTIAYSAEAAIVFQDKEVASEILSTIAQKEQIWKAAIHLPDGSIFTQFEETTHDHIKDFLRSTAQMLFMTTATIPIEVDRVQIGTVIAKNDGRHILNYALQVLAIGLLMVSLLLLLARSFALKMAAEVKNQLEILTTTTRSVHQSQDFSERVPAMKVVEFDQLGQDFNELFGKLQAFHASQQVHQRNLEARNETLSQLAIQDSLTGLCNRRGFEDALVNSVQNAQTRGQKIAVLYLDNDKFKRINDEYGHAAGDALLIDVARRIRHVTRDSDLVARLGGDEFTVLLTPVREAGDAVRVAQKIIDSMDSPLTLEGGVQIVPGVSIGIAVFPDHANSPTTLLEAADHAMYIAKQNGRGHWRLATQGDTPVA